MARDNEDEQYAPSLGFPNDDFNTEPGAGGNPFAPPGSQGQYQDSAIARRPEGLPPVARTIQRIVRGAVATPGVLPQPSAQDFNQVEFRIGAGESRQLAASDIGRIYLVIQNVEDAGGNDFRVAFGKPATANSLRVFAGGNYEPYVSPTNSISIFSALGASGVIIMASAGRNSAIAAANAAGRPTR